MGDPSEGFVYRLDEIDRKILHVLQQQGRISNAALATQVGLSPSPCLERVRKLERGGYILGYNAVLNPALLDAGLLVFVQLKLGRATPDVFDRFNNAVQKFAVIQECHLVSGDYDYLLKTRVSDMASYRELVSEVLLTLPGVSDSRTYVVMEEVKHSGEISVLP